MLYQIDLGQKIFHFQNRKNNNCSKARGMKVSLAFFMRETYFCQKYRKTQETYGTEKSVGKIYMEMFSEVSFLTKNQVAVKVVNINCTITIAAGSLSADSTSVKIAGIGG